MKFTDKLAARSRLRVRVTVGLLEASDSELIRLS